MRLKKWSAILAALSLSVNILTQVPVYAETEATETAEVISDIPIATNEIPGWPTGPQITADSAIVLDDFNNTILYGKNIDTPLYPGTTVKIMTMLVALECCPLDDEVTMTATGVSGVTDGGVSISAQLDEVFTVEQCLYAIMLKSANDIALQLAEHVGGTMETFIEMMNSRAKELGCTNTLFTNPTGLPDENQHTTAHDMALIMQAAMKNDTFRKISSAQSYTIQATNKSNGERVLTNSFTMTMPPEIGYYADCIGGKKGYTTASGETLMCAAERNNMTLYCVILKGPVDQSSVEAGTILDYAFDNFHIQDLGRDDFDVIDGGKVTCPVSASPDDILTVDTDGEDGNIERTYTFGDVVVGHATCIRQKEEDPTIRANSETNMKEAEEYSAPLDIVPYAAIFGIGGLVLLILLIRIIKVIKS